MVQGQRMHGTFSSPQAGSGERFTEQVYLPTAGSPGQTFAYNDFYLGMVVAGDPGSIYHQSYAQLVFTPSQSGVNATVTWSINAAVWAMHNETAGGNLHERADLHLEQQFLVHHGHDPERRRIHSVRRSVSGGSFYNVTFDGVKGNLTDGMWI